ncbi:hypothetical protein BDV95DRAFT_630902 [Massariosphaeria phaeospora]|uniref:Zn(2)-C6 fungal-type domain-containing protein n=1 Tax=Massariosphaeria phaeospora TaxID=100035 RepID=A0A7C8M4E9_9PLEO|nr:hypothetical protein BDV95DRAFT_630902 [Massariosphaeria phaeospora]
MRSRTGCLTCRQRKLKCDEKKPICSHCRKASRECVPNSGIVFRHQHNASMNGDSLDETPLKGFYAYKNTFDEETVWLDTPKHITFVNTTNPYLDPPTPEFDMISVGSVRSSTPLEPFAIPSWSSPDDRHTLVSAISSNGPDPTSTITSNAPAYIEMSTRETISPPPVIPDSRLHILMRPRPTSATPPPIDPRLTSQYDTSFDHIPRRTSEPEQLFQVDIDPMTEHDHEVAFLLRWFSEGPGHWMDLFDLGTYFASYVPVKARQNPLLRYAAIAYAAKALARVHGRKPIMGGNVTRQALMELYPDVHLIDWHHKATEYYDTAVTLLLQALKDDSSFTPEPELDGERLGNGRRASQNTDELLAASAILSVYEFLDASAPEWAKHLNGAKSLLEIAQEHIQMPILSSAPAFSNIGFISKARRATFWNIARQDMLAAFINKTHTRFDTEDLSLWKGAGLLVDEDGFILPSNSTESGYPEGEGMMKEDLICNALVWLMAKLVNFMAAGDELPVDFGGEWAGVPQRTLLDYWYHLRQHFQTWHNGLPVTFQPCARVAPARIPGQLLEEQTDALFPEIWYSIPMCASTMQCYHMSQIQLLMNKPHESTQGRTTVFARLSSYQSVLAACQAHSHEIIGISLARSDAAVRIHSVQPLFTAGQCLSEPRERQVVLELLRDIETDIGWATDYRVQQLLQQWQQEETGQPLVS